MQKYEASWHKALVTKLNKLIHQNHRPGTTFISRNIFAFMSNLLMANSMTMFVMQPFQYLAHFELNYLCSSLAEILITFQLNCFYVSRPINSTFEQCEKMSHTWCVITWQLTEQEAKTLSTNSKDFRFLVSSRNT